MARNQSRAWDGRHGACPSLYYTSRNPLTILGVSVEAPTGNLVSAGFASLAGLPILRTCKTSHRVKPGNIRTCVVQRGTSPVATISCSGLVSGHQSLIHRDKPGGVLLQNRARSFSGLSLSFKAQRFLHVAHQAWLFPAQVGDEGLRRWLRAAEGVPHN